uniref:Late endosomal/lysosomal adaptor and MAPK and MTOR activator 4 n=1 Tax=Plectus sambesii TaxID=2011161 RepID=A0A914WTG3_9BILA
MEPNLAFLAKIPDQVGYQVISADGAVVKSSGDLANRDTFASVVMKMLQVAQSAQITKTGEPFKYFTVNFDEYFYSISVTGKLVYVVKRKPKQNPPSPTKNVIV